MKRISLNDRIKVQLTPRGAEIYYHRFDELHKRLKAAGKSPLEPRMPRIDKDGFTEFQLWDFMQLYGEYIGMACPDVIVKNAIFLIEE